MKKVLFASTALVLTAGVASAEITLSGSANMGLKYDGSNTVVANEIDVDLKGSGETDGGLSFGASLDLDAHSNNSAHTTNDVGDPEVFIAYNGLTLTVGDIGEAQDVGGISDLGFDGIGVDDVVDSLTENGSDDVRIDYAFGDFSVAVTMDSSNDDFAASFSGSVDAFSFSVGLSDRAAIEEKNVTVGYSAGAFGVNVTWRDGTRAASGLYNAYTGDGFGIDASYTTGDVTVTGAFADAGTNEAWGLGVAYDLGGATLAGGFGEVNGTSVADLGISFSF